MMITLFFGTARKDLCKLGHCYIIISGPDPGFLYSKSKSIPNQYCNVKQFLYDAMNIAQDKYLKDRRTSNHLYEYLKVFISKYFTV